MDLWLKKNLTFGARDIDIIDTMTLAAVLGLLAVVSGSSVVNLAAIDSADALPINSLGETLGPPEAEGAASSNKTTFIPCGMPVKQFDWYLASFPPVCR